MANTYVWDFPNLEVHNTAQNGHDDVINVIHWTCVATSDSQTNADGEYISVTAYGSASLTTPDAGDSSFVAFNSVTKDWCKTKALANIGKTEAELQTTLDDQVNALENPPIGNRLPSGW